MFIEFLMFPNEPTGYYGFVSGVFEWSEFRGEGGYSSTPGDKRTRLALDIAPSKAVAMKQSFVQCAELLLEAGADPAAPGGAVTLELCGSWDHPDPCRWPHETLATWDGLKGRLRVVFVAEKEDENHVRAVIERALSGGECLGPDGRLSRWKVAKQAAGALTDGEVAWAARIAR